MPSPRPGRQNPWVGGTRPPDTSFGELWLSAAAIIRWSPDSPGRRSGRTAARNTRFLGLVERIIPRLAAWIDHCPPKAKVTRSNRVGCAIALDGNAREVFRAPKFRVV